MHVTLTTPELIAIAAVALLIVAGLLALYIRDRARTAKLRRKYGAEYDRAVRQFGSRRKAEAELLARESRVRQIDVHEIPAAERDHYSRRWSLVQSHFVDSPAGALGEADELISSVMAARGYPADDCAAGIFVNHPGVAEDYRLARACRTPAGKREPTTEELRTGLLHYRALFDDLVGPPAAEDRRAA